MYAATFCFLGVAGFIVAVSAYLSKARKVEVANIGTRWDKKPPTWRKTATWREIKNTWTEWTEWYARCQEMEASKRKAIRSLARTLVLCAALCIVGVVLEVEFGQPISVDSILSGFGQSHPVATSFQSPHSHRASEQVSSTAGHKIWASQKATVHAPGVNGYKANPSYRFWGSV